MGVIEFNKAADKRAFKTKIQLKKQGLKSHLNTCAAKPSKLGFRKPVITIANDFANAALLASYQRALNAYLADLPRAAAYERGIENCDRLLAGLA